MLKAVLNKIIEGGTLTQFEAEEVMNFIMDGEATHAQIGSLLSILRLRGETVEEMTGFVKAMRNYGISLEHGEKVIDTCGTGGDGASTFNISTASAIVLSAIGVKVAKHGNRAISSKSGSADVLEELGIPVQTTPDEAIASLKEKNMCFLFAPLYHSSMKHVAVPRKELGFRTIFNILGPLANPANSQRQLLGVYDAKLALKMAETLRVLGTEKALFVTGENGLDEISATGITHVVELENNEIKTYEIDPAQYGMEKGHVADLQVANAKESAELIEAIFDGKGNATATNTILLNAGAGLYVYSLASSIQEGIDMAREAIDKGKVREKLEELREIEKVSRHA